MPAVIAQILRYVIIAIVQSGIAVAAMSLLDPLIDKAKEGVKSAFGLGDNDAMTYVANFILDTAELAGITVVTLKSRIPLRVADKLGFTTRNYTRGALPAKVSSGASAPGTAAKTAQSAGTPSQDAILQAVAAIKGTGFSAVQKTFITIGAVVGGTTFTLSTIGNWIDFGNWNSGAYQGTFQKVFAVFGLEPDKPIPKASTVSSDVWDRVYNTYVQLGAYAINDPYKQQSVVFSRQALIDLVDKIGAELNATKGNAPAKAVLAQTHALVLLHGASSVSGVSTTTTGLSTTAAAKPAVSAVRVFTGVLSKGVLGAGLQFTARPDDLIESVQELQDAATNNLAAALTALPTSLSYELKIVSSVITKDGFKQTGATQQVVSGYTSTGAPKYRTVTNKFAVLDIYLLNEKGTRTKVRSVILGPTNVLKFNPTAQQMSDISGAVKGTLVTSNTSDISSVVTNVPIQSASSASAPAGSATGQQTAQADSSSGQSAPSSLSADSFSVGQKITGAAATSDGSVKYVYTYKGSDTWSISDTLGRTYGSSTKSTQQLRDSGELSGSGGTESNTTGLYQLEKNDVQGGTELIYYPPGMTPDPTLRAPGAPAPSPTPPSTTSTSSAGANATNLSEWYSARGQALPSLSQRSLLYQQFGLGQSTYYTGTAEQNTKLLAALKANS